jgi:hypothetical protein
VKIKIAVKDAVFEFEGQPTDGPAIFPFIDRWLQIVAEQGNADTPEFHAAMEQLKTARDAQKAAVASNQS